MVSIKITGIQKPEFPGIIFSEHCAKKTVDSKGTTIKGEGIQLKIPENAIEPGKLVDIAIQGCIDGPFVLPDDIVLVSPVYLFTPSHEFLEDVTLTIEHYAELESDEDCGDVYFITSPTKPEIQKDGEEEVHWEFSVYAQPDCTPRGQHAKLYLRHFCLGALAKIFKIGIICNTY